MIISGYPDSLNESAKSFTLNSSEMSSIEVAVGSMARAGIAEANDVIRALDNSKSGKVKFQKSDLEFLEYWWNLLQNYPNSPKTKYMDEDFKSALNKLFKHDLNESKSEDDDWGYIQR